MRSDPTGTEESILYVGIAEYKVRATPGFLACRALGSCVGICLWDEDARIIGLLHALLPIRRKLKAQDNPARYADTGTLLLADEMVKKGAKRQALKAKLVGGACMYQCENLAYAVNIGQQNIEAAKAALDSLSIPLLAQDVGGRYGRSIQVAQADFSVTVTILSQNNVTI